MDRSVTLKFLIFLGIFTVFQGSTSAAVVPSPYNVFYVFSGDLIHVIEPESNRLIDTISNTSSPGLCTRGSNLVSKDECWFSGAQVIDKHVYVSDNFGSAVKVIDVTSRKLKETVRTEAQPAGIYHLKWLKEAWVHSWSLSTLDVINTDSRLRTHYAIQAHTAPGWTHGEMVAHEQLLEGRYGYVSHISNEGVHKVNLVSKTYAGFLNLSSHGCMGTWRMVLSLHVRRIYVECRNNRLPNSIVELDPSTERVTRVFQYPGIPYASPNGHFIVSLYRSGDISRVNIIDLSGSSPQEYPSLSIPGGVTDAVFYPKRNNPNSYYVFVTLQNINKMAVVDLEMASKQDNNNVTYVEDVDDFDTSRLFVSRKLYINGKWIISAATKSKTVVIVNAETQKVHGKIPNVDDGELAVWVNSGPSGPKSFVAMIYLCLLLKFFF